MARTEWVSGRDGAFFLLESATTPYHAGGVILFEGPQIPQEELLGAVARKLPLLPRFRQRLAYPAVVNRPVWIDDPHFDLEYHVRRTSLPEPGSREQLAHVVAELMEEHVSRFRPLWELWVIDGMPNGDFALLLKMHHAMADGVTGARDVMLLFDADTAPTPRHGSFARLIEPWVPRPAPGTAGLLADAALRLGMRPAVVAGALARAMRDPVGTAATALGFAEIAAASLRPAPRSSINAPIGPNRTFDFVTASLEDVKDVKNGLGGTINDVVVAVTAGGLRHWMLAIGEPVDGIELRALIPISLRRPGSGQGDAAGNMVTGVLAPLPVGEPDPVTRLHAVRAAMDRAKHSRQALGASALLSLPSVLPPMLARRVADIQRVQRFFNLSLTNVPGPTAPLYLCGRAAVDMIPAPPLSANTGLVVGAMSYAGRMSFGMIADPETVPAVHLIAEGIEKSLFELIDAASNAASARGGAA